MAATGRAASRILRTVLLAAGLLGVAGCHKKARTARVPPPPPASQTDRRDNGSWSSRATAPSWQRTMPPAVAPAPVPRELHGAPFQTEVGLASWYGPPYAGRRGADGTVYDQNAMTAAHLTLPMGSLVRVTNLATGQSAVVRITDRGPFVHGRIIDLSLAAAKQTGVYRMGVARVRVEAYSAPPPATAAYAHTPTPAGGRWCVQIGAFLQEEDAISLKNDLMRRYTTAKVIEFAGPTGHWVRINLKNPDKQTALQVADSIHVPDAEPYVIRLD
ncbi:MAG: septal ring lytic transglycosylase RlpA family protein [Acidobacteriota bacterium]|nr:septal ring lytic transglycosylase RlpA family protein [Acidobacteriota bacterium]